MNKPRKTHDSWCPELKGNRCGCTYQLANEAIDDYRDWIVKTLNKIVYEGNPDYNGGYQALSQYYEKEILGLVKRLGGK